MARHDGISLQKAVATLKATYGRPSPPAVSDPWQLILWENVAYLADDEQRKKAFDILKRRVGTKPEQIVDAPYAVLEEVTSHGAMSGLRVEKLRRCAQIALDEFDSNLQQILDWPASRAQKALMMFPGIGAPGADKILLFCKRLHVLAVESNGLRVLLRLGFGEEKKSYATTYRFVQAAIAQQVKSDYRWLIAAHQLLRQHGQELCRKSQPQCNGCPLARDCRYYLVTFKHIAPHDE